MADVTPENLVYAATARCTCGAGMALATGSQRWQCSAILLGTADSTQQHTAIAVSAAPIVGENDPAAGGETTREGAASDTPTAAQLAQHTREQAGQSSSESAGEAPAPGPLGPINAGAPPAATQGTGEPQWLPNPAWQGPATSPPEQVQPAAPEQAQPSPTEGKELS